MAVPRMTQLHPGTMVNIILKADQPTGKLSAGSIADFLTRGDHPRGIKVRLTDGKVGRVQSLASAQSAIPVTTGPTMEPSAQNFVPNEVRTSGYGRKAIQNDYRDEEQPEVESSLLDYIRVKAAKKSKSKVQAAKKEDDKIPPQQQMESEYPELDSALVAAILADNPDLTEARKVLSSLC